MASKPRQCRAGPGPVSPGIILSHGAPPFRRQPIGWQDRPNQLSSGLGRPLAITSHFRFAISSQSLLANAAWLPSRGLLDGGANVAT